MKDNVVYMKFHNGHRIITLKKKIFGYKWIGTYEKPKEEKWKKNKNRNL